MGFGSTGMGLHSGGMPMVGDAGFFFTRSAGVKPPSSIEGTEQMRCSAAAPSSSHSLQTREVTSLSDRCEKPVHRRLLENVSCQEARLVSVCGPKVLPSQMLM